MLSENLKVLENKSIYILREAYAHFSQLGMLWSMGKDSTVLLWLCRKAFLGKVPFPVLHVDTSFKIPEMIEYRDRFAIENNLDLYVGKNNEALHTKATFPAGSVSRIDCCQKLKTDTFENMLKSNRNRTRLNHHSRILEPDNSHKIFNAIILGIRSDEEGSRSKERYFSPRDLKNHWDIENQPAEIWGQGFIPKNFQGQIRIHPLLDWTEKDIWQYIMEEQIPVVSLYYASKIGTRYRSLGCYPCTKPIDSRAQNAAEVFAELDSGELAKKSERSGRAQDKEDGGGLESLRSKGYM